MYYLLLIILSLNALGIYSTIKKNKDRRAVKNKILLLFFVLMLAHIYNTSITSPHTHIGISLSTPGSPLTQGLIFDVSTFIRRCIEPANILTYLYLLYVSCVFKNKIKANTCIFSAIAFAFSIILEAIILSNSIFMDGYPKILTHANLISKISLLVSLLAVSILQITSHPSDISEDHTKLRSPYLLLSLLPALVISIISLLQLDTALSVKKHISAIHYYLWFPENWKAGYAHKKKNNKEPHLGEYHSDNLPTLRAHARAIEAKNINVVFIDWWPTKRNLRKRGKLFIKNIPQDSHLRYAIHLETQDLADNKKIVSLSEKNIKILNQTILGVAQTFFKDPRYLTINNKKVINIYTTRHMVGDFPKWVANLRTLIKEKTGFELYLIGDEAYFNVLSGNNPNTVKMLKKFVPEWKRITALNALTLYNPYDPEQNYGTTDKEKIQNFLHLTEELYNQYVKISTTAGIPFIPTIIPGYDDSGVRPLENHQVIERMYENNTTFNTLEKISLSSIARYPTKITTITSWNEWNEGTNVEE